MEKNKEEKSPKEELLEEIHKALEEKDQDRFIRLTSLWKEEKSS